MAYCQELLVVGKYLIMFLKVKFDEEGEIDQGGASNILFVAHNGQSFGIPF